MSISIAAMLIGATFVAQSPTSDPLHFAEAQVCPPSGGDLDYILYEFRNAPTQFTSIEADPAGGRLGVRIPVGKTWKVYPENQQYLFVRFETFSLARGYRVIAEIKSGTIRGRAEYRDADVNAFFQTILTNLAGQWPCQAGD